MTISNISFKGSFLSKDKLPQMSDSKRENVEKILDSAAERFPKNIDIILGEDNTLSLQKTTRTGISHHIFFDLPIEKIGKLVDKFTRHNLRRFVDCNNKDK
jgi:hypothetical protein